jgi:hypothetical protein
MSGKVSLYYGDNGSQAFWEDRNRKILILKNYHETRWLIMIKGELKNSRLHLQDAINDASSIYASIYGTEVVLDHSHTWQLPYNNKTGSMVLEEVQRQGEEMTDTNHTDKSLLYEIKIRKRQGNWRPQCNISFASIPVASLNIKDEINLYLITEKICGCIIPNNYLHMDFPLPIWKYEDRWKNDRSCFCCGDNKGYRIGLSLKNGGSYTCYLDWRTSDTDYSDYIYLFQQACDSIVSEYENRFQCNSRNDYSFARSKALKTSEKDQANRKA